MALKYSSSKCDDGADEAFRSLTTDEISSIYLLAEEKRIVVNIDYQTLSCFEGKTEVHFARISSGAQYDALGNRVDVWETPVGEFPIWRKAISLLLSGGSASAGWSLPSVGWVSYSLGRGLQFTRHTGITIMVNLLHAVVSMQVRKMRNGFSDGVSLM